MIILLANDPYPLSDKLFHVLVHCECDEVFRKNMHSCNFFLFFVAVSQTVQFIIHFQVERRPRHSFRYINLAM